MEWFTIWAAVALIVLTVINLIFAASCYREAGARDVNAAGAFASVMIHLAACAAFIWLRISEKPRRLVAGVAAGIAALGLFFGIFPNAVAGGGWLSLLLGSMFLSVCYEALLVAAWLGTRRDINWPWSEYL